MELYVRNDGTVCALEQVNLYGQQWDSTHYVIVDGQGNVTERSLDSERIP
jgi:hypothetical protein